MEPYIKNNVSDITYQSELTPAAKRFENLFQIFLQLSGLIHTITYSHF